MIFTEALPLDLSVAFAKFEDIGIVELEKKNFHNLIGKVPGKYQIFLFLHVRNSVFS